MTDKHERQLSALIDESLAGSDPDPHSLARALAPRLSRQQRAALILDGLTYHIRRRIADVRRPEEPGHPGPSRWQVAQRVCPGGDWKLLDDCGFDDLMMLASEYRQRSEEMARRAAEYEALAERLLAEGAATVGELRDRADLAA